MAANVSDEVRRFFRQADLGHDGRLSVHELSELLRNVGSNLTDSEVTALFQAVDRDGTGHIVLTEFVDWVTALSIPQEEMKASIRAGTPCIAFNTTDIWESPTGWKSIGKLQAGTRFVADGVPQLVEGYNMVPIRPKGAVEMKSLYVDKGLVYEHLQASIVAGTRCVAFHEMGLWKSMASWERIGDIVAGQELVADGPPETWHGYDMVPVRPHGAVEMKYLHINEGAASSSSDTKAANITLELLPTNSKEHFTLSFVESAASSDDDTHDFKNAPIVFRRGATVKARIIANSSLISPAILESTVVVLQDLWDDTAPRVMLWSAGSLDEVDTGKCFIEAISGTEAMLLFGLPHTLPVGEYSLSVAIGGNLAAAGNLGSPRVMILMNPWCGRSDEYVSDDNEREEYVLLEGGLLFRGMFLWPSALGWVYGQFEPGVLAAVCKILKTLPAADRASPALVSRAVAALCNAQDDNGVLVGNWSGDYRDGKAPTSWTGSVDILSNWVQTGSPIKYGQCWVFAGVLTSALRCLGIAARPVTNFESAHDANSTRMIEKVYDEDGKKLQENGDSIWNYHVWVEAWMARPDLQRVSALNLSGWQAVDATPQEISGNKFQCGPASLAAVKLGLALPYDTDFVIGEVNADVRRYVRMNSGELKLVAVNKDHVGRKVLTKQRGSWDENGIDITHTYKAAEGSILERASLLRSETHAAAAVKPQGSLSLHLNADGSHLRMGSELTARLKLQRQEGHAYPAEIKLALHLLSTKYTGHVQSELAVVQAELSPSRAETEGVSLSMDTSSELFKDVLLDAGFSMIVVGCATWAHRPDPAAAAADGDLDAKALTVASLVCEEEVELIAPEIVLLAIEPPPKLEQPSTAWFRFENPFAGRRLTNLEIFVEGLGLLKHRRHFRFPELAAGGTLDCEVKIEPPLHRRSYLLVVTVECDEVQDIHGKFSITIA